MSLFEQLLQIRKSLAPARPEEPARVVPAPPPVPAAPADPVLVAVPVAVPCTALEHLTFDRWQLIVKRHGRELADHLLEMKYRLGDAKRRDEADLFATLEADYWSAIEAIRAGNDGDALAQLQAKYPMPAAPASQTGAPEQQGDDRQVGRLGPLITNPAEHLRANRSSFPPELVEVLQAIAAVWKVASWSTTVRSEGRQETITRHATSQAREYTRLVCVFEANRPADVAAWLREQTAWYTAAAESEKQTHDGATGGVMPAWSSRMQKLLTWLDQVRVVDLPPAFELRPGVSTSEPAVFLAALRREVGYGPGGLRARRGLLQQDLEDLARVWKASKPITRATNDREPAQSAHPNSSQVGDEKQPHATPLEGAHEKQSHATPPNGAHEKQPHGRPLDGPHEKQPMTALGIEPARPMPRVPSLDGKTPADHLAELGGFDGVARRFEPGAAHLLWDAARLWERDRGTPLEARWEEQYRRTWENHTDGGPAPGNGVA